MSLPGYSRARMASIWRGYEAESAPAGGSTKSFVPDEEAEEEPGTGLKVREAGSVVLQARVVNRMINKNHVCLVLFIRRDLIAGPHYSTYVLYFEYLTYLWLLGKGGKVTFMSSAKVTCPFRIKRSSAGGIVIICFSASNCRSASL